MNKDAIGKAIQQADNLCIFDVYLLHQPTEYYFAVWRVLEDTYREGKSKAIGVANFYPHTLINFCEIVTIKSMVIQVELHPYFTQKQALFTIKEYNIIPEEWSLLTGERYNLFENEMLLTIAKHHHKTIRQILLRWNMQRCVIVIPKSTHIERIIENIDIFDFTLTDEEMYKISSLDIGYS